MTQSIATFGDKTLLRQVSWRQQTGTEPAVSVLFFRDVDAKELMENGGRENPYTLKVRSTLMIDGEMDTTEYEIKGLYVVGYAATQSPHEAAVIVADRRFWWNMQWHKRAYNVRRKSGVERIRDQGSPPLNFIVPRFEYAYYSRRPAGGDTREPWTAREVIEEAINIADPDAPVIFDESLGNAQEIQIEGMEIDETADSAVARALRYIPESAVTVTPNSEVKVFYRAQGLDVDRQLSLEAGAAVAQSPLAIVQDTRPICPSAVDVLFTPEVEVRMDIIEKRAGSVVPDSEELEREMENVVTIPDYSIEWQGETYPQGAIIDLQDYIEAIGPMPGAGTPVTMEFIRTAAIPSGMTLFESLVNLGEFDPNNDWAARTQAIQASFRRSYRMPRAWIDNVSKVAANRIATVGPDGVRGPAVVFSDYALLSSAKKHMRDASRGRGQISYATNIEGWRERLDDLSIRTAPCLVSVADMDLGIISLDWTIGQGGMLDTAMVLPGRLVQEGNPGFAGQRGKIQASRPIFFNAISRGNDFPQLDEDFRASAILTVTPANKTYKVRVTPQDVADVIGKDVADYLSDARGGIREVRIQQARETARIKYEDDRADDIDRFVLTDAEATSKDDGNPDTVNLKGLVVNETAGQRVGAAGLQGIARGYAASIFASFAPHITGNKQGGRPGWDVELDGWAESIECQLDPSGAQTTTIAWPDRLPEIDFASFLPSDVQALLFKMIPRG